MKQFSVFSSQQRRYWGSKIDSKLRLNFRLEKIKLALFHFESKKAKLDIKHLLVLEDEVAFYLGFPLAIVDGCRASGSSSIFFVVYEEDCVSVFFDLRWASVSLNSCTWNRTDTRFIFCFVSFLPKAHFRLKMLLFALRFILQDFQSSGILFISCNHTNISSKVNKQLHSLRVTMSHGQLKRSQTFCIMDV